MTKVLPMLLAAVLAVQAPPTLAAPKPSNVSVTPVPAAQRAPVVYAGPLIAFKAVVAGREVWALIDTGTASSAIDLALARELKLKVTENKDSKTLTAANVPVLVPGQFETRYPHLAAVDLSGVPGSEGRKIGFVLGQDFFRGSALIVDPATNTFALGPSGGLKPLAGAEALPLTPGQPLVTLAIGGQPVRLNIDTSFSGKLSLTPSAWAQFVPRDAEVTQSATTRTAKLPALVMGPATISNVAVTETPSASATADGSIGLGLLNSFVFTLDIGAGRLWISPIGPMNN